MNNFQGAFMFNVKGRPIRNTSKAEYCKDKVYHLKKDCSLASRWESFRLVTIPSVHLVFFVWSSFHHL